MTQPVDQILPKSLDCGIAELLTNFSKLIDEFVNYGTHIFNWVVQKTQGSDEQMPLILFFRDLIEKADSISILISKSSIDPAKTILRSMFELHLYLDYLIGDDYYDRAMSFLVWDVKRQISSLKRFDKESEQYKHLLTQLKKDKSIFGTEVLENIPSVSEELDNLTKLLEEEEYIKIENEYEVIKLKNKNPSWYRLFNGPKNIKELAEKQEMSFLYEILYREWSACVHGTDILQGKIAASLNDDYNSDSDKIKVDIIQMRFPKDAQKVSSYCLLLLLKSFRIVIDFKVPERTNEFKSWYLTVQKQLTVITGEEELIKIDY